MKKYLSLILGFLLCGCAISQTISPIQSPARPYNLDIVNPVMLSGSDEQSINFNKNVLPQAQNLVRTLLPEFRNNYFRTLSNDFSRLTLDRDYSIRSYFISEGASWSNSIGFYTNDSYNKDITKADSKLIFPDSSSSNIRTMGNPLQAGDFVDIGRFKSGDKLDFFIIARGATNPTNIYSTNHLLNSDGLVHAVSFSSLGSTYLLLSFEDVHGGGDRDMNDSVMVLEFKNIVAPEPSMAVMGSLILGGFLLRRKR